MSLPPGDLAQPPPEGTVAMGDGATVAAPGSPLEPPPTVASGDAGASPPLPPSATGALLPTGAPPNGGPPRPGIGKRFGEWAGGVDAFATRVLHAVPTAIAWPLAYAASLGVGAYVFRHLAWVQLLDTNKIPKPDTYKLAIAIGVAALALLLVYGVSVLALRLVARRRGERPTPGVAVVAELHRRLRFLLAAPLLAALTLANIERDSPKETFFLIVLLGVVTTTTTYAWLRAPRVSPADVDDERPPSRLARLTRLAPLAAFVGIALLWVGYAAFFSRFAITNHHALHTSTIDLGIYDNIFYQSAHGHPLGCSFIKGGAHGSAHFDPILVVLSPLYRLYPHAEFLLVLQSVWLGAGVIPVYLIAKDRLGSGLAGFGLATMYALYPAVHGANMYDFHSLALITPLALFLLYFLETGRRRAYWAMLLPMLLVREDISILLCFVGAYAIFSRKPGWARIGWVTIVLSFVYFAVAKRVFMSSPDVLNSGDNSYSFAYYYEDLIPNHNGALGLFISIFTNPVFILKTALSEPKVLYLATLFVPLAFLPFVARPARVLLGWGLFFSLLASRGAVYSTHFQYSSLLTPMAFGATPLALRQIADGAFARNHGLDGARLWKAILTGAFVMSLLCSWKFGGLLENATFHAGFAPATRSLSTKEKETYAWLRAEVDKVPIEDSVGATNRVGAHVSNRARAYHYGEKVGQVDWALVDENELHGGELEKHNKLVQSGALELVSRRDKIALFRRKPKPARPSEP